MKRVFTTAVLAVTIGVLGVSAQRGGGGGQAPQSGRGAAPIDITGTWVSLITEDWVWRMVTPPKGDYASVPLNAAARKVADSWDPARDTAAGEQCRAYGAAAVMRLPGRIRISWADENTLRVETEAGTQTRLWRFGGPTQASITTAAAPEPGWQGSSVASWVAGRGRGAAGERFGSLTVVTTSMRSGYLRKNGVPYSANARLTEYVNMLNEPNGDRWLVFTTMVEDPMYLTSRFVISSNFKKVADPAWTPTPCEAT